MSQTAVCCTAGGPFLARTCGRRYRLLLSTPCGTAGNVVYSFYRARALRPACRRASSGGSKDATATDTGDTAMPKAMKGLTVFCLTMTLVAGALFGCSQKGLYLTLTITFGTVFYHLAVRLLVGFLYNAGMKNRADLTAGWYRLRPWEDRLYKALRVKAWKGRLPTYVPENFSPKAHTWREIAQAMCQAELVHETNVLCSFLPIVASRYVGAFWVFFATSVCGAAFDLLFVILQRYNRGRVMKIIAKTEKHVS